MKKIVSKFIRATFAAVLSLVIVFSFGACDILEDLLVKAAQSSGSDSSSESNEAIYMGNIESLDRMNKVVPASEVLKNDQDEQRVKEAWYDDEGNYNYIIYLGRINNFLLHNVYSFQYTKNYKVFGDAQITRKEATVETVQSVYTKTIQRSTTSTIETSVKTTTELSLAISKVMKDSVKLGVENQINNVLSGTCTETDYNSYTTITTKTQETIRQFKLDYDRCRENEIYSYCVVTDVDVYSALSYNPEKKTLEYSYYSDAVGMVRDIVFSSEEQFTNSCSGKFKLDLSNFSFEKPDNSISNHEPIKGRHLCPEKLEVAAQSSKIVTVFFGDYTKGNGQTTPYMSHVKGCGYTKMDIKITFYYVQHSSGKWYFYLSTISSIDPNIGKSEGGSTGPVELNFKDLDIDQFVDYNKICLIFKAKHWINGFDINSLVVEFTIHQ